MDISARDIMTTSYQTLRPDMPVPEAIGLFRSANELEQRRVFGMMVVDEAQELVGMLSMFDILLAIRPKHIAVWGEMEELLPEGLFTAALERLRTFEVGDLMTRELVTITPDTPLLVVMDLMIRHHVRRIPVVENRRILGIIYISDLFYELLQGFMNER
jgi:CBS domain-containing protein